MPQIRAVMSGGSVNARPRRNASKNRGGSKMRNRTSASSPSRISTIRPPSPSTRVRASTWKRRARWSCVIAAHRRRVTGRSCTATPSAAARNSGAATLKVCSERRHSSSPTPRSAHAAWSASAFTSSDGPKQPKQPRRSDGHSASHPPWVIGPRHAIPSATRRHGLPSCLHSTQTLWALSGKRRPRGARRSCRPAGASRSGSRVARGPPRRARRSRYCWQVRRSTPVGRRPRRRRRRDQRCCAMPGHLRPWRTLRSSRAVRTALGRRGSVASRAVVTDPSTSERS